MHCGSDTNESVRKAENVVPDIASRFGILRVYLFGSRSRGDNKEDSDYDFLILCPDGMKLCTLANFMDELRRALGNEVDFAYEDFASKHFMSRISPDLRLIYEQG